MRLFVGLALVSLAIPATVSAQPVAGMDSDVSAVAPAMPKAAKVRAVPARTTRPAVAEAYRINKQVRAEQLAELRANSEDGNATSR